MRAIVGHSDDIDTRDAVAEIVSQCEAQLDGEQPVAALVFMSTDYEHAVALDLLDKRWPGLPLIGGSTDGELSSERGFQRDSLLVTLLVGDEIEAVSGLALDLSGGIDAAVDRAVAAAGGRAPQLCLTAFAPTTNSTAVIRALDARLAGCPVLGGLTADHREYSRMSEFSSRQVSTDSLTTLMLFGDLQVSWGIGSGWFPIGSWHEVTATDGHVVSSIDGKRAIDVYRDYWGDVPTGSLGEYPLAVFPEGRDGPSFLRAALGCDPSTGSIRFAGDVPMGSLVRITEVLPDGILAGSEAATKDAVAGYRGSDPALALAFSCAARKWVLGTKAEEEAGLLHDSFSSMRAQIPMAGFYCFGEIAPFRPGGATQFHNETCVSVLLGS